MKLRDLLVEHFKIVGKDVQDSYSLDYKMLEGLKDRLLQCDEFKEVDSLSFTDSPSKAGIQTESYLLNTNVKFIGDAYLYQIFLTPRVLYDEEYSRQIIIRGLLSVKTPFEKVRIKDSELI